jgi:thiol-disulfide isomerase/thioredoxin
MRSKSIHPIAKSIHVVYAEWCPHCIPATLEPMKKAAVKLGASFQAHDIDTSDVQMADELVKKYGDWSPDYLVPQVFLEFEDGSFKHVLTGDPRGVAYTERAVEEFLSSRLYLDLKAMKAGKGRRTD